LAAMKTGRAPDISVVVPVFNEAENLEELQRELAGALERTGRSFEVILVDDGSTDSSWDILQSLQKKDARFKLIRLRRNFGQTAALSAGFDRARGDIIISRDADLQNDPNDIPLFIQKIEGGYDIVSGWRKSRKDKFFSRRVPSVIANRLISGLTGVRLHDYGCTLKAFRSEVIKNVKLYGELHRFIPAIASQLGVEIAELEVNHRPRKHGKSKYSIARLPKVILDLLTVKFLLSYSTRPLQIFGLLGLGSFVAGLVISIWLSVQRLFFGMSLANRPLLLLGAILIIIGFQFIMLGLLAEIMVRAYHESSGKTIYVVREVIDSEEKSGAASTSR
jgi:glycosyltransferase involved in cell wall biosynthesis